MRSLLIISLTVLLGSFAPCRHNSISGHWTSAVDLYDMKLNDTLIFSKKKYTNELYQWGGALCGVSFGPEKDFSELHNVLCSSESSPVRYSDEKWDQQNNIISISSPERELTWNIISISGKELRVLVTKLNIKNE
ncbi:MAG: hypothetical protein ACJ77K_19530 [Bacteroidia bacterium]